MSITENFGKDKQNRGRLKTKRRLGIKNPEPGKAIMAISGMVFALIFSMIFAGLLIEDIANAGKISKGVKIAGIDVGGLTKEKAQKIIREKISNPLKKPLILLLDSKRTEITPKEIRLSIDEKKMVEEAYWAGRKLNILERMLRSLSRKQIRKYIPVSLVYDEDKLSEKIHEIAVSLNRQVVSASIDMSKGRPIIRPSRYGLVVDEERTLIDVKKVLATKERIVEIRASSVTPEITEDEIGKIVVVKLSEHKLYLYDKEELIYEFKVAVGSPQYPTPTGKFSIIKKKKNPTWYPPKSDWAKGLKPIPPGPGNPLGPYWMEIGNGVGIHSTPDVASLGYSVSHGCIRMSEWAAMQLFNAVTVGTPVFILP